MKFFIKKFHEIFPATLVSGKPGLAPPPGVICIAIFSFMFFYKVSDSEKNGEGYFLNASFQNIDGLAEGNDVKLSGIKIGYIDNLTLENGTYFAVARLKIKKGIDIPSKGGTVIT